MVFKPVSLVLRDRLDGVQDSLVLPVRMVNFQVICNYSYVHSLVPINPMEVLKGFVVLAIIL